VRVRGALRGGPKAGWGWHTRPESTGKLSHALSYSKMSNAHAVSCESAVWVRVRGEREVVGEGEG